MSLYAFRGVWDLHVKTRTLVPVHLWSTLIEKLILQRHVPRVSHLALQGRFMWLMVEFTSKVVIIFFSESSLRPLALSGQYDITLFCIKLSNLWALPAKMANEENPRHDLLSCMSRDVSQRDANEYECFHNPLSNVNIHQHANTDMYSIRHASGCVHHISVWFELFGIVMDSWPLVFSNSYDVIFSKKNFEGSFLYIANKCQVLV